MSKRVTNDSANTVSLFPFLAVLLCTMGALLVLLVVLAQRAGERAVAEATEPQVVNVNAELPAETTSSESPSAEAAADTSEVDELTHQLEKARAYQQQLTEKRKLAEKRLRDDQQRLSHLEEHTRRLEHELARLALASEQLKATEQDQTVDQKQAEQELKRQQQLLLDAKQQLEELREDLGKGKRSYAIVPYRGPNGTYRKPVYIECRKDGIILHPEGIQLKQSDFLMTSWAGNPLAAALRATRDYGNAQAAKLGASEPPDPYPLILVRPDAIGHYNLARAAITSWDASFGYEFIDSDWELSFPETADPLLARTQQHAIDLARQRMAHLIRSAPRRFARIGQSGSGNVSGHSSRSTAGYGSGKANSEYGQGDHHDPLANGGTGTGTGNGHPGETSNSAVNSEQGEAGNSETQYGAMAQGSATGMGQAGESGDTQAETGQSASEGNRANGATGDRYAQAAGTQGAGTSSGGSPSSGQAEQGRAGSSSQGTTSASAGRSSIGGRGANGQTGSIAETRGRNWAVKRGSNGAVPIRRPITVVVRPNQIALLPSRHAIDGDEATGKVIKLDQTINGLSNEFIAALRTRVEEWGLAGRGLYWRPVLKLNVGPGAEETAQQVIRLLEDSGVELSLPETARAGLGGQVNAPR